eukprot:951606-Pleurochrysis_carterae.AAC.1
MMLSASGNDSDGDDGADDEGAADDDDAGIDAEDDADDCSRFESSARCRSFRKLWSTAQFPEGMKDAYNSDIDNLVAAQSWCCPCEDRGSCISSDRIRLEHLVS